MMAIGVWKSEEFSKRMSRGKEIVVRSLE